MVVKMRSRQGRRLSIPSLWCTSAPHRAHFPSIFCTGIHRSIVLVGKLHRCRVLTWESGDKIRSRCTALGITIRPMRPHLIVWPASMLSIRRTMVFFCDGADSATNNASAARPISLMTGCLSRNKAPLRCKKSTNRVFKAQAEHPDYGKVMMIYWEEKRERQVVEYDARNGRNDLDRILRPELMATY